MNTPIPPVTIINNDVAVDLTGVVIRCNDCNEVIEPIDRLRGKLLPHQHVEDGNGCSGVTIEWGETKHEVISSVTIMGLTKDEMDREHPVGLRKVLVDALNAPPEVTKDDDGDWIIDRLMPVARAIMLWEREGCAQLCDAEAESKKKWLERADEGHDSYASTHVSMTTAEDLAEEIRDRDDFEAPAPTQRDGDECPSCHIRGYRDGAKLHAPDCPRPPKETNDA